MGKRQEAALETKRKIADAVNVLLREKSLDEMSIEEITTRAGVAKGSFYTYFKRKEDAACCAVLDKYDSVKKESLNPEDGIYQNLCTYLSGSVQIIEASTLQSAQGWMKSVTNPLSGDGRGVEKYIFDWNNIKELLENAVRRGELAEQTPTREITDVIMNAYYGAVATWCITSGSANLKDGMEHFCKYALKAMVKEYMEEKYEIK